MTETTQFNGNAVDEVLSRFVALEIYQPKLAAPKSLGNWIYATNTHAIAIAKKTSTLTEYAPHEMDVTVIQPILEREASTNNRADEIPLSAFKAAYGEIPTSHERVPEKRCPECRGEGVLDCDHCGSQYECKACDGEGMLYAKGKFTLEFEHGHAVKLGEAFLQPKYVKWLVEAAETLGVEFVTHVRAEEREEEVKQFPKGEEPKVEMRNFPYYQEFQVGEMRIGIMPIRTECGMMPNDHQIHEVSITA